MTLKIKVAAAVLAGVALSAAGCHSSRISAMVENQTGLPITLLEVDYPSASFGVDALAAGGTYRYQFKVRDSGAVKVQYTEEPSHTVRQASGPTLSEGEAGRLEIVLLPSGKVKFLPELTQDH